MWRLRGADGSRGKQLLPASWPLAQGSGPKHPPILIPSLSTTACTAGRMQPGKQSPYACLTTRNCCLPPCLVMHVARWHGEVSKVKERCDPGGTQVPTLMSGCCVRSWTPMEVLLVMPSRSAGHYPSNACCGGMLKRCSPCCSCCCAHCLAWCDCGAAQSCCCRAACQDWTSTKLDRGQECRAPQW
jgi:hypothetical protein